MNVLFTQNLLTLKRHLKIEQLFMNLHTTNIRSRYCLLYARNVIQWGLVYFDIDEATKISKYDKFISNITSNIDVGISEL
jgi:hypothetical protein